MVLGSTTYRMNSQRAYARSSCIMLRLYLTRCPNQRVLQGEEMQISLKIVFFCLFF